MTRPGRKPQGTNGEALQRVTLTVDEVTLRRLKVLGEGNVSLGARRAALVAYDRYQRSGQSAK